MISAKKKPPRCERDGQAINNLEGKQMHYNLTSDDLEVEIGELIEQYTEPDSHPAFGLLRTVSNAWEQKVTATIHLDARFTGEHVESFASSGKTIYVIHASGADLCEALRNVRNAFVEAAPAEKAA